MPKPTIIIHGGAGSIHPRIWQEFREGSHAASVVGQAVLDRGGSALDAAIAATLYLENHPAFNAGTGSALNRDGMVENDALVMTDDRQCGAVAGVSGIRNPVLLARVVLEQTAHILIVGAGARKLADDYGIEVCDPASMIVDRRRESYQRSRDLQLRYGDNPEQHIEKKNAPQVGETDGVSDTVGAAALDASGRLAVASSTGGIMLKLPGRAGDTPVIGSGSYCGPAGAVTCTGHGEAAMRVCLAKHAYDLLEHGATAGEAAGRAVDYLVATIDGKAGLVVVDANGNRGWATSTSHIAVGIAESLPDAVSGACPAAE